MLELADILQIDATVIAGVLILLTVTSLKLQLNGKTIPSFNIMPKLTAFLILPFAGSAIQILSKYLVSHSPTESLTLADVGLPLVGFIYLIGIVVWIAIHSKKAVTDT